MKLPLTVGDIMTRDVTTTTPEASIREAVHLMLERRISGLPVLGRTGMLLGILTEGDMLRRVELGTASRDASWLDFFRSPTRPARDYVATHSRVVGDIMTRVVVTADEAAPLSEVVGIMQTRRVRRVPVLSGSQLVGILSRADLLRTLADTFADVLGEPAPSDAAIRNRILAEFGQYPWAAHSGIRVTVDAGQVELNGVIFEEAQRLAIRVAAQNVPGVVAVHDHLEWGEKNPSMVYGFP